MVVWYYPAENPFRTAGYMKVVPKKSELQLLFQEILATTDKMVSDCHKNYAQASYNVLEGPRILVAMFSKSLSVISSLPMVRLAKFHEIPSFFYCSKEVLWWTVCAHASVENCFRIPKYRPWDHLGQTSWPNEDLTLLFRSAALHAIPQFPETILKGNYHESRNLVIVASIQTFQQLYLLQGWFVE